MHVSTFNVIGIWISWQNLKKILPFLIVEVCTIRLDFESFNLLAGTGTTDALGDCQDKFTIGGVRKYYQNKPCHLPFRD